MLDRYTWNHLTVCKIKWAQAPFKMLWTKYFYKSCLIHIRINKIKQPTIIDMP